MYSISQIKIKSICTDEWAQRVQIYWYYLCRRHCTVLFGEGSGSIRLIRKKDPETGLQRLALLFTEPLELPKERNYLWHEMGHLLGERSKDPVLNEFYADKYAMDTALSRGCHKVAEEIVLRCVDTIESDKSVDVYKEAAKLVLHNYQQYCWDVVNSFKKETSWSSL